MPTRWREGSVWTQTSGLNLYEKEVLADAPFGYWRFREAAGTTVEDVTGNGHDGTTNGGVVLNTPSLDGIGSAAAYDGTDDYTDHGTLGSFGSSSTQTIECWIRTTTTATTSLCGSANDNSTTVVQIRLNEDTTDSANTDSLRGYWRSEDGLPVDGSVDSPSPSWRDGAWHHIVTSCERSTNGVMRLWIDGIEQTITYSNQQTSSTFADFQYPFTWGARNLRGVIDTFSNIDIDEIAMYDFLLSDQRVQDHYRAAFNTYDATVLSDNPTAYWRFGESSGATTAVDETGNGWGGTYNGNPSFKQGGALSFKDDDGAVYMDGAGDAVDLGDVIDPQTESFTVEAWIKIDDVSVTGQRIQVKEDGTNGWALSVGDPGSGAVRFFIHDSATFTSLDTTTGTVSNGVWHHVVGVYDSSAGTRKIYVDAVEEASATDDTGGFPSNTSLYGLAAKVEGGVQDEIAGVVDEFAVYKSALSATRIQAHYDKANR